jgi:hypothetical protein
MTSYPNTIFQISMHTLPVRSFDPRQFRVFVVAPSNCTRYCEMVCLMAESQWKQDMVIGVSRLLIMQPTRPMGGLVPLA